MLIHIVLWDDEGRMAQFAELLRGEVADCLGVFRVRGVGTEADVRDEVHIRHCGESALREAREKPLERPRVAAAGVHPLERVRPVFDLVGVVKNPAQHFARLELRPAAHRVVEMPPRATPRRPAPDRAVAGKVIAAIARALRGARVRSGDQKHALVFTVSRKQFLAEREKRGIRQAVVFEHNRLPDLGKNPAQPASNTRAQAEVFLREIRPHIARPVHAPDHRAGLFALLRILVVARPVGDDEQRAWTRLRDGSENTRGDFRAVENEEGNRCVHGVATGTRSGAGSNFSAG